DRDKFPTIIVRDMETLTPRFVAAPGMNPRWFPSGKEIAYFLPDNFEHGVVVVPDALPEYRRFTLSGADLHYRAGFPGRTIVISTEGRKLRELRHFVADIDSTGRLALTIRAVLDSPPTLRGRSGDLLVQDATTGDLTLLLTAAQIAGESGEDMLHNAGWMPDGRSVLYLTQTRAPDVQLPNCCWRLHLLDISTKRHTTLHLDPEVEFGRIGPFHFAVSPDGKKIAFSGLFSRDLWVYDLTTSETRKLDVGEPKYWKEAPRFSPDGKSILFELTDHSDVYHSTSFWIAPATGGEANRLFPWTWRNVIKIFVLGEVHRVGDWWQPRGSVVSHAAESRLSTNQEP